VPVINLDTYICCAPKTAFDLSRSIDLHIASTEQTNERAVLGRTTGLIEMGENVTWEATHFGIRQRLTSRIVMFESPQHFRDTMVSGAFKRFDHDHYFIAEENGTLMKDIFDYTSPCGLLGDFADALF